MNPRQLFIFQHFQTLLKTYSGGEPFHSFFKKYAKINPALGSKDRKILRELVYSVFRSGNHWQTMPFEELFLLANHSQKDALMSDFYGEMPTSSSTLEFTYPFSSYLVKDLQHEDYIHSLQQQPLTWVRIAHKNSIEFSEKYKDAIQLTENINEKMMAFGLKNNTVIQEENYAITVQDLASQKVSNYIEINDGSKVWDCCSGAGGKSLFVTEKIKNIKLYASDIRPSILENLKQRFKHSRLNIPKLAEVDLLKKPEKINFNGEIVGRNFFDCIIADVPCSGSGTWGRDPENLSFFKAEKIEEMALRQFKIVSNILRFVKPEGKIYYITCSVFERENSEVIRELESAGLVKIISEHMELAYRNLGDNLYIAELKKIGF